MLPGIFSIAVSRHPADHDVDVGYALQGSLVFKVVYSGSMCESTLQVVIGITDWTVLCHLAVVSRAGVGIKVYIDGVQKLSNASLPNAFSVSSVYLQGVSSGAGVFSAIAIDQPAVFRTGEVHGSVHPAGCALRIV